MAAHRFASRFCRQTSRPDRLAVERVDVKVIVMRRVLLRRAGTAKLGIPKVVHASLAYRGTFVEPMLGRWDVIEQPVREGARGRVWILANDRDALRPIRETAPL